ncbi:MAG: hypothetical protein ACI94Y_003886 [Maribacter sp.]|jgi:hypothetical protein
MVSFEESKNASLLLVHEKIVVIEGIPHPIDKINPSELADYIIIRN